MKQSEEITVKVDPHFIRKEGAEEGAGGCGLTILAVLLRVVG